MTKHRAETSLRVLLRGRTQEKNLSPVVPAPVWTPRPSAPSLTSSRPLRRHADPWAGVADTDKAWAK